MIFSKDFRFFIVLLILLIERRMVVLTNDSILSKIKTVHTSENISLNSTISERTHSVLDRLETMQSDVCSWPGPCENIGPCIPDASKPSGYFCGCYDFVYVGDECSEDNLPERNFCEEKPDMCKNGGVCKPVWGGSFCECPDKYHGMHCENQKKGGSPKRISSTPVFLYDADVTTMKNHFFIIFFEKKNLGEDFTLQVSFEAGEVFVFKQAHLKVDVPYKYRNKLKSKHLHSKLMKESTYMAVFEHYYWLKDTTYSVEISVLNKNEFQFFNEYIMYLKPDPSQCVPVVELRDCGTGMEPSNWKRKDEHVIKSYVERDCIKYNSKIDREWQYKSMDGKPSVPKIDQEDETYFKVPRYTLSPGMYRLLLKAHEIVDAGYPKKSFHNEGKCFFSIEQVPLVGIINGGEERIVGPNESFVVNASASYDPDEAPDNQKHLRFVWSCTPVKSKICHTETVTQSILKVPAENFAVGDTGTFVLKISAQVAGSKPKTVSLKQIVKVVSFEPPQLTIVCLKNCGRNFKPNTKETIIMKVECIKNCEKENETKFYEWDIKAKNENFQINWESDTLFGKHDHRLGIKPNILKPGKTYVVTVTGDVKTSVKIDMTMNTPPRKGYCDISHQEGISGITEFSVACDGFSPLDEAWALTYYIYQDTEAHKDGTGKLLSYSTSPESKVNLMPGKKENDFQTTITIKVSDYYGEFVSQAMTVKVKPFSDTVGENELIDKITQFINGSHYEGSIQNIFDSGDMNGVIQVVMTVCDMINEIKDAQSVMDSEPNLRIKLIEAVLQVPINNIQDASLVSSALLKVTNVKNLNQSVNIVKETGAALKKITEDFLSDVKMIDFEKYNSAQLLEVSQNLIDTTAFVISTCLDQDISTEKNETDYPLYEDIEPEAIRIKGNLKYGILDAVRGLNALGEALGVHLISGEDELKVQANNITLMIKADSARNLCCRHIQPEENNTGINISGELASYLANISQDVKLQVGVIPGNVFWWHSSDNIADSVTTGSLLVSISKPNGQQIESDMSLPIQLYFKQAEADEKEHTFVTGKINMSINWLDETKLDGNINVHRVHVNQGDSIMIIFEPFTSSEYKLKVTIALERRPSAEDFSNAIVVPKPLENVSSEEKKYKVFTNETSTEDSNWFYVGIAPHEDMIQAFKRNPILAEYTFAVHSVRCQYWKEDTYEWSTTRCYVGDETTYNMMHCSCYHLSLFSGSFLSPDSITDKFRDISMALSFADNPFFVSAIGISILLFLIILFWARRKDKKDLLLRQVILLKDNCPEDNYAYLVTVYTGHKWNAGTSSNVGIEIVGELQNSKPHILNDRDTGSLKRSSDKWYLLFTSGPLGQLNSIQLWHDNSGDSASWFCNRIIIRDLLTHEEWTFLPNRWFSLTKGDGCVYYTIIPATEREIMSFKELFSENFFFEMDQQHNWLKIMFRHPRSSFTLCQRTTTLFVSILIMMLVNVILHGIPKGDSGDLIYIGSFEVSSKDFIIAAQSCLITLPLTGLINLLFRKSRPYDTETSILNESSGGILIKANKNGEVHIISASCNYPLQKTRKWFASINRIFLILAFSEPLLFNTNLDKRTHLNMESESNNIPHNNINGRYVTEDSSRNTKQKTHLSCWNKNNKNNGNAENCEECVQYLFPPWVIYIAWFLSTVTAIVTIVLLLLFGHSYCKIKSYLWISSVLITLFIDALMIQTIKIIVVSALLSVVFKRQPNTMEIHGDIIINQEKLYENRDSQTEQARNFRSNKIYRPLNETEIQVKRKEELEELRYSQMFFDFILFTTYLVILYIVVLQNKDLFSRYSTKSFESMFIEASYTKMKFHDINSNDDMIAYLQDTFIPTLHEEFWYNGYKLNEYGWTSDYNTYLLGIPRLRQIRICNSSCRVPEKMKNLIGTCYADYSPHLEETKNYSAGWSNYSTQGIITLRSTLPWIYKTHVETKSWSATGLLSTYGGGGYIANLGRTKMNSFVVLSYLAKNNWFDQMTRAIIIEFTTYNINHNLFNIALMLVEKGASGIYVTNTQVYTMGMLSAGNRMSVPMKFLSLTLIVLLLLLLCRQIMKLLMRSRWRHQIFSVDVIDVFIILIGLCCIGIFFIEDTYISSLIHHLYEAEPNEYVSFYTACEFHLVFSYMTAALLCISTIRLWKLLSFAKNIQLFEITLIIAKGCIIATLLAFLLTAASFSSFSYILLHTKSVHFSEAYKSFHYLLLTALGFASESNHELYEQAHFIIGPIFYLAYTISVTLILLNLFITVLMVYYDKVQKIQISMSRRFKFGAYMKSKFQSCFKRKKNPQSLRLRGGGDTLTPKSKVLAHGVGIKVVPKPNEMLNINEVLIPKSKIYSMKVAMHEAVQSIPQTDSANNEKSKRIKLITAAVLNIHKTEVPEDLQSKDVSFFYSGIAKSKLEVIPLKKFLDMKSVIENMFNSEQSYKKGRDATINDINVGNRDSDINIVSNHGITEERNVLNFNRIEKEFDEILSFIDTVTHVEENEEIKEYIEEDKAKSVEEGKQRIDSSAKQSHDGKVYPTIDKAFDVDINENKNKKSLDPDVTEISYDDTRKYGRGEDSSDHNFTKSHFLGSKSKILTDTRRDDIISDENKKLLISKKIEPAFESIPPSEYPKMNEKKRRKGEKRKQTISENVLGRVCCLDCSNEKKRRMGNFQKAQPRVSEGYNKKSSKDFLNYTDNITKQKYYYKDYIKQTEKYGASQSDKTKERVDYCGLSIPLSSGFRSKIMSDTARHTARNQQNRKHINRYQGNMVIDAKLSNYKKNIKPTQINTCLTNNQRKDRIKLLNLDKDVNYDCKPPCSEPYQNSSDNFQLGHTVRHTMCEKLKVSTPISNNISVKEQQNIKQYCSSTFGRDFTLPQYQTSSVRGETNLNRNNSSAFVFMGNLQPSNLSEEENTQVKCGLCFGDEVSQIYFHDETLDTNVKHAEQRKNYLFQGNTQEFLHHSTSEGKNCRTQSFLDICPHCQANMRIYKNRGSQCKFVDESRRLKEKSGFHVCSSSGMSQNETYLNVNLVDNGIKTMEQGIQTDELHDCHLFNQSKNAGPHNRDVQEEATNLNVTSQQTTEQEGTDLKIMVNSEESNTSSITIQLKQQKKQNLNYQTPTNSNVTQPSHSTSNVADSHQSKNDEKISEVNIKVHETYSEVHVVIGNKQK